MTKEKYEDLTFYELEDKMIDKYAGLANSGIV